VDAYVAQLCSPGTHNTSGRILILMIMDQKLITPVLTIICVCGSTTPRVATQFQMDLAIICLEPTVLN